MGDGGVGDHFHRLLFWDALWIINDLLAPLSLLFHEFQQNSNFF
jgi:hypothetical protein